MTSQLRYAAAGIKARFSDWKNGQRSADAELFLALGVLRERSRALRRDNPYARKYFTLRSDNVIGHRGFSFSCQAKTTRDEMDKTGNYRVEAAWQKWCERPVSNGFMSMRAALEQIDASRACDGDVFIEIVRNKRFRDTIAFTIHESDMVDETMNKRLDNGNQIRMGVELNPYGEPVAYHFLTYHRGDTDWSVGTRDTRRVPADNILHIYKQERPYQTRGAPDTTAAMIHLKMLDGYAEAEVTGRRSRATVGGFFTRPPSPDTGMGAMADTIADDDEFEMELEPGQFRSTPPGWEYNPVNPNVGGDDFSIFNKAELQAIASALGVSYVSLANNLEGVSFSSIRQGVLEERERWKSEQEFLIDRVLQPIYRRWLSCWMDFGDKALPITRYDKFAEAGFFIGRRWPWVDPLKDVQATALEIQTGLTTYSDVARERGIDYDDLVDRIAADQKLLADKGIVLNAEESATDGNDTDAASGNGKSES